MLALCAFLLIACYYDYRYRRIPNVLAGIMLVTGLARSVWLCGVSGTLSFLIGAVVMFALLYPAFKLGAIGAGDVKLFAVCSGYLDYSKILHFLFFALLVAAIISLMKLMMEHNIRDRLFYLKGYFLEVARSGQWHLYIDNERESYKAGIPLAGPILCSVLMCIGGVY